MASGDFHVESMLARNPTYKRYWINAVTSAKTIQYDRSGSWWTNEGATGTVTVTLPQSSVIGQTFTFYVIADYALRVEPGAAGAIYIDGAKQTDNKYVELTGIGTKLEVTCVGNHDWAASVNGTFSIAS